MIGFGIWFLKCYKKQSKRYKQRLFFLGKTATDLD
jgi:hypothetical protein